MSRLSLSRLSPGMLLKSSASQALALLSLSHLLVDMHSSILPVLLVYQRGQMGLSLAQVGLISGVYNFGISLGQPIFGHLSDRWGERVLAIGGLVWVALFGASLGFAPSYSALIVLAALQSFGPAAFHPPGAAGAGRLANGRKGASMSFFLSGGSVGTAMGPIVAAWVFSMAGLPGTAIIGFVSLSLALLITLQLLRNWPAQRLAREAVQKAASTPRRTPLHNSGFWLAAAVLLLVTGARTSIHMSLTTFVPQYLVQKGFQPAGAGKALSLFLVGAMLGVISGGPLSDRFGPRRVITLALVVLGGVLLAFPHAAPLVMLMLLPVAGFTVGTPLSMTLVIGQAQLGSDAGLASGVVMGASFVAGALGVTLTGLIANHWGMANSLTLLGWLALLAALAAIGLPKAVPEAWNAETVQSPS